MLSWRMRMGDNLGGVRHTGTEMEAEVVPFLYCWPLVACARSAKTATCGITVLRIP